MPGLRSGSKTLVVPWWSRAQLHQHATPYMESLNAGHIIIFGQGTLRPSECKPNIGTCVYDTSKISIRAFTKGLADEEREFNVCVLSIGPGVPRGAPVAQVPGIPGGGVASRPRTRRHGRSIRREGCRPPTTSATTTRRPPGRTSRSADGS